MQEADKKLKTGGEPFYIQIESKLRSEIINGILNPGQMLPSEATLMTRFEAGRDTVRRSLKELEHEGLIYTRPGKGYFVAEPEHNLYSFYYSDEDSRFDVKVHRINVVDPTEEIRLALELPKDQPVVKFSRLIQLHGEPVAYDEKYVPYDKGTPLIEAEIEYTVFPDIASSISPPFAFYTRMEITSEPARGNISKTLGCAEGRSLLVLYRYVIGKDDKKIGFGKKYLTDKYGKLEAISGYKYN